MSAMIELHNVDCMEYLATLEDNAFELAIVDPPYGIGNFIPQTGKEAGNNYDKVDWNDNVPDEQYFEILRRVSRTQIIWGANYYNCFTGGAIVWDKHQFNPNMSRCEIASVSKGKRVAYYSQPWAGFIGGKERANIHPCEKPVKLYEWLLMNYAKEGDRILDTHLGSGSIAIACHNLGFDLVGCELDTDYFEAAQKRLEQHQLQLRIPMT